MAPRNALDDSRQAIVIDDCSAHYVGSQNQILRLRKVKEERLITLNLPVTVDRRRDRSVRSVRRNDENQRLLEVVRSGESGSIARRKCHPREQPARREYPYWKREKAGTRMPFRLRRVQDRDQRR